MFSKACEYAIRAVLFLAVHGKRAAIKTIAKATDSPEPFTAKILQKLSRAGIIASAKGPGGGFFMEPAMLDASLLRVVQAIDGVFTLHACALGLIECSDKHPCPVHQEVKAYKHTLRDVLSKKSIRMLTKDLAAMDLFFTSKVVRKQKTNR
jgi:Rrf2 family protein